MFSEDFDWLISLNVEEINLIKNFLLYSGSLKDVAREYSISYPTIRNRLNQVIQKIENNEQENNSDLIKYIKRLALNDIISIKEAKHLINLYKKENENNKYSK